jgi:hypothetical protein
MVSHHRGTLLVILTCPHDGDDSPPGVSERTGSCTGRPPFKKSRDRHTRTLTMGLAQLLLNVFGEALYVVIAEFRQLSGRF